MAKLPSLITDATSGEALNYSSHNYRDYNPYIKQTFEVTQNSNFTWTVKSKLYIKLPIYETTTTGYNLGILYINIGNQRFNTIESVTIYPSNGVWIGNKKISSNSYEWTKILEGTMTYTCNNTGRYAIRLYCGYLNPSGTTAYLFDDYTYIYDTFPAFSGAYYKINNGWKSSMPWIKINGEWKRAKQFVKVNNQWKECKDSWIWNPES